MDIVRITTPADIAAAAQKTAEVLKNGGVILYPTDTIYGLGADALSDEAVDKIYAVKNRKEGKFIRALVDSFETLKHYAEIDPLLEKGVRSLIPGPTTFIFKKKLGFDTGTLRDIETFGARVPDNTFCLELTKQYGRPITATSANKSGLEPEHSVEKILEQLGLEAEIIDLVIDAGVLPPSLPSTVVDLTSSEPKILREGAVSAEKIQEIFG
ncbi:MAG: L-threonylcarbamoyladenylate synthase [Candidatus Adlerbacteria bacterium]|nr:L-threonylcarbamoyladenylate synthase [Candidatus Adlerbacteria bacterium]